MKNKSREIEFIYKKTPLTEKKKGEEKGKRETKRKK